ncbi:hypothetical protein NLU13_6447 [Sarocladium strictum]|uniref:Zn(2)-C6 fungal-type domain-containing protein n=1 Tax=Sarocladium strictum TaxID=5046 RepID=A0AA39L756_SARSR|nr:hypothetical protein NLU13_6447 [Sarocladium strictum]
MVQLPADLEATEPAPESLQILEDEELERALRLAFGEELEDESSPETPPESLQILEDEELERALRLAFGEELEDESSPETPPGNDQAPSDHISRSPRLPELIPQHGRVDSSAAEQQLQQEPTPGSFLQYEGEASTLSPEERPVHSPPSPAISIISIPSSPECKPVSQKPQGRGKKRKVSPSASISSGSDEQSGGPVKRTYPGRRGQKLNNKSCEKCKNDKKKCTIKEGTDACTLCLDRGLECVRLNVDKREHQWKVAATDRRQRNAKTSPETQLPGPALPLASPALDGGSSSAQQPQPVEQEHPQIEPTWNHPQSGVVPAPSQPQPSAFFPSPFMQEPVLSSQQPVLPSQQPVLSSQQPVLSSQQAVLPSQQPVLSSQQVDWPPQPLEYYLQQPFQMAQQPQYVNMQQVMSLQQGPAAISAPTPSLASPPTQNALAGSYTATGQFYPESDPRFMGQPMGGSGPSMFYPSNFRNYAVQGVANPAAVPQVDSSAYFTQPAKVDEGFLALQGMQPLHPQSSGQ